MKKLLVTVIGAAAAIGAFADYTNAQRFEGMELGSTTISALNTQAGGSYWSEYDDSTKTNEYTIVGMDNQEVSVPAAFAEEATPSNALSVKTQFGKPLEFKVDTTGSRNIGSGLYFDSQVKFTVCDADPAQDYSGAKIVLWLQTNEAETETNLMVKAGYLYDEQGVLKVTNKTYTCGNTIDGDFADKWHRVTIKAMSDITENDEANVPAFAIYIDGGVMNINATDAKCDQTVARSLTYAANALNTAGRLFPSLIQDPEDLANSTLTCVGFDGTGSLNDLVFTDVAPDFAKDAAAPMASITIGQVTTEYSDIAEAITAINGQPANTDVAFALVQNVTLESQLAFETENENVNVTIDFAGFTIVNNLADAAIVNNGVNLIITNSIAEVGGITGKAVEQSEAGTTMITAGNFRGVVENTGLDELALQISGGSFAQNATDLGGYLVAGKALVYNGLTELYDVEDYVAPTVITIAENPWYVNPVAVVLAENLPEQTGNYVSAFHGQGEGEYLGLTYSTNPQQFDLFQVNGTETPTTLISVEAANVTTPGFRGVAISKTLGIAMTLAYATSTTMYAYPLAGGTPTAVTKPSTYSFDAAAFSPDGKYLFSNALNGESSNQFYVKWEVSNGGTTLTKVGSISAGGRGRNLAYARINGRDLVFAMADTGKVVVLDMTGDDASAWTATDLITNLPAHSYGTLCVSGVTAVDAQGNAATPHLTVATSTNNGATKIDVLNVYALTVPASGTVSASLVKSFDEDALTAGGFGDISDANRYGNTVYVTEDEATIYFARPDAKLYGAQFGTNWVTHLGLPVNGAYTIDDLADLKAFQKGVADGLATAGLTFKLTADIALDAAWPGIGIQNGKDIYSTAAFDEGAFCGTFDGQNYTISGFQMVGGGLDYCGFFNSTYGATIQNLKIQYDGALFATDTSANSSLESGATFVGVAKNSTLRNLTTLAGTVSCDKGFGGIVGYLTSGTLVDSCTNNVNMTSLKPNKCGGIAMITQGGSAVTIQNCQNNGTIAGSNETGGLVGFIGLDTTITDCESTVAYKLFHHNNGTVTLSGVKGNATVVSYTGAATPGLNFATVDGNVATFVADNALEAGKTYKVMAAGATATFEFAEASTIAFDTTLATPTYAITENGSYAITANTDGTTTTYTAVVAVAKIAGGANYATLKDAVDAADTGDTVVVLADCAVPASVSFTKNVTVSNDYTIAANVNYALCIGATVTFEGSGMIQRGSTISGSAFCVGANETTRGAITAGTAGTLVFNGGTVCGGNGGNQIKLENGTVEMNGGVLKDGLRGIKADADAGSYTSAIVINGGTITNFSAYAVFASAESATGKATITINGGVIAGPVGKAGKGDETITIPGTSTAKFNADQSSFCESGYETTLSDGWYVVTEVAPAGETIVPGEQSTATYDSQAAAEAALANVTIVAADDIATNETITAQAKEAYLEKFEAKVVPAGEGQYKVEIGLTAVAEAALQTEADADIAELPLADIAAADVSAEATVTATPGFYYTVESGTEPDALTPGTPVLATGNKVTLPIPNKGAAGFYKIKITPTK